MVNYMLKNKMQEIKDLRYERKFVISNLDLSEILFLIKHNPAMFSEIFYQRRVNNIYLDSIGLDNYHENLAGSGQRIKIRIRWYGKVFGLIKKPVLELKIKNNELGDKKSFPLKPFVLDKKFSLDLLQKVFSKSNLPAWLIEELKFHSPTLLNSYKRRYFQSANKKYRLTLDEDLIFFKIKNKNNLFNEKLKENGKSVLEIKYSSKDYKNMQNITQFIPFRLIANSKYVCGIDLLEL